MRPGPQLREPGVGQGRTHRPKQQMRRRVFRFGDERIGGDHRAPGGCFLHDDLGRAAVMRRARRFELALQSRGGFSRREDEIAGRADRARMAGVQRRCAVLTPQRAAGLTDIVISYDDAHAAFVREAFIANALAEARALDIVVRIAVVVETGSTITASSLRTSLGLDGDPSVKVYQTIANSTGRASEQRDGEVADAPIHPDAYRGPCQSVLNTAEIDHDGGVRPCCGVLPHHDALRVGHLHDRGIVAAMQDAAADPLFRWISLEGPISILAKVTADDAEPIRAETFDGICTACDRLFGTPALLDRVRAAAEERRDWLDHTEALLQRLAPARDPVTVR